MRTDDTSLAARAAWMHFAGGLTQSEVARRLGLTSLKAHRLITKASQDGLVKVYVDCDVSECIALEDRISSQYGLEYCEVVADVGVDEMPVKTLGIAGSQFLKREMERDEASVIGVGHGRTLAACVDQLPRFVAGNTRFVSLLGGLTRKFSASPHDVIHRLAEKTGADAYVMPVPFFANTAEDRSILLGQKGIREVFNLARGADLFFVGIGTVDQDASLVSNGMIERDEIEDIKRSGGVGELLGHFFDEHGQPVETALSNRTLSVPREDLGRRRIVAVAGGSGKISAIRSILKSRTLGGLITDERTAMALVLESGGVAGSRI